MQDIKKNDKNEMTPMAGTWSEVTISGKRADVYEPARPAGHGRGVVHLHGHGLKTLKDDEVFSAELERHGLRAVCPHGARSWWLDVVCPEFDERVTPLAFLREQLLPWIEQHWQLSPPQIGLMGLCMGGQGVLQLAYRSPSEFPVVAAICPVIDFHQWHGHAIPLTEMFESAEAARQQTAILQILPLHWPRHQLLLCDPDDAYFAGVERLAGKLSSSGVPYESDFETTGGGHCWEYCRTVAGRAVQHVADGLEAINAE